MPGRRFETEGLPLGFATPRQRQVLLGSAGKGSIALLPPLPGDAPKPLAPLRTGAGCQLILKAFALVLRCLHNLSKVVVRLGFLWNPKPHQPRVCADILGNGAPTLD